MHRQPPGDLGQNASKCDPSTLRTYCLRDETRRYKYKRKQEDTKVLNQGCQLQSSSEKSIKQFCGDPAAATSSFSRMLPECQCVLVVIMKKSGLNLSAL